MKKFLKYLFWCIVVCCFWALAFLWWYYYNLNQIREYSSYCMDNIRSQLWEELEWVSMIDADCSKWVCVYKWWVNYDSVDYTFKCSVENKDKVNVELTPMEIQISVSDEIEAVDTDTWALLIVFSPTGHTKEIATYISEINGAEFNELVPVTWYSEEDINWRNEDSRSYHEYVDASIRPEIASEFNLEWYDTIYLWFPIWFWRVPNIILTLLENYDLSGKNVVLFCTSWSSWIEWAVDFLKPYNLNIIASKRFAQWASKEDVRAWLESY